MHAPALVAPEPLHDRVYRGVANEIASGRLLPGARLPTERALGEAFGVSRATVRRALARLAEEGLLASAPGRGRVVSAGPLAEPPNALMSFTELGSARGLQASSRVLSAEVRPATLEEAERFAIAPGADLFVLRRTRLLDGIAVAVDCARVPLAVAPELPTIDFSTASLYDLLERKGVGVVRGDYTTEARGATAEEARRLGVEPGAPLLVASTLGYSATGRTVEFTETAYRGDRYRFRAILVRVPRSEGGTAA